MTVAVLCHPFGTGQMTLPGAPGAVMFTRRIDVQHDARHFGPICAIGFGIKKAQIGDEMFVVVAGQLVSVRSLVGNRRIERRLGLDHVRLSFPYEAPAEPRLPRTGAIIVGAMIRHGDGIRGLPRRSFPLFQIHIIGDKPDSVYSFSLRAWTCAGWLAGTLQGCGWRRASPRSASPRCPALRSNMSVALSGASGIRQW